MSPISEATVNALIQPNPGAVTVVGCVHGYAGCNVPAKTCQARADFANRLSSM